MHVRWALLCSVRCAVLHKCRFAVDTKRKSIFGENCCLREILQLQKTHAELIVHGLGHIKCAHVHRTRKGNTISHFLWEEKKIVQFMCHWRSTGSCLFPNIRFSPSPDPSRTPTALSLCAFAWACMLQSPSIYCELDNNKIALNDLSVCVCVSPTQQRFVNCIDEKCSRHCFFRRDDVRLPEFDFLMYSSFSFFFPHGPVQYQFHELYNWMRSLGRNETIVMATTQQWKR